jgi:hypothetical protein
LTKKQDLQDRLQRAESWIEAAESLAPKENHQRFIFYYVALNAMYGRRQYEGDRSEIWQDLDRFVQQVKGMCGSMEDPSSKSLLAALQGRYVEALLLDYFLLDDLFRGATREKLMVRCKKDLLEARLKLRIGDPFTTLRAVLQRLTVLRNRVLHGCVTYGNSSKGLPSVLKGGHVARALVPSLYALMLTHGLRVKWDPIPYPRVGFEDPLERLDLE